MSRRLAALALLLIAPPAFAHAILIDSTPAPLAHIHAGPLNLVFRYNSRIDAARSKLTLKLPDQTTERLTIQPAPTQDVLKTTLTLSPGPYVAAWQVLATDGHITRGTVPFTVDPK
jgi:methionine-rich copper-binding protein CopC